MRTVWTVIARHAEQAVESLEALLLPWRCVWCGGDARGPVGLEPTTAPRTPEPTSGGSSSHLCEFCRAQLRYERLMCRRCAAPLPEGLRGERGCPRCLHSRLPFEAAVALGPYDGLLREAVIRAKQRAAEPLAWSLGRLLAEARRERLREAAPDLVLPAPMHWRRRWQRGANHAEALAAGVATGLQLPLLANWLNLRRATSKQGTLRPAGRRANVRGAFEPTRAGRRGLSGRAVLLVDDVFTTGATLGELARTVRRAGASRVVIAVAARALRS